MGKRLLKTNFTNLLRDKISGVYFCHAKVGGKLIRASLKTKSSEIAKSKLDSLLEKERERLSNLASSEHKDSGDTFKAIADSWMLLIDSDPNRKPKSKVYRRQTLEAARQEWPEVEGMRPHEITKAHFKDLEIRLKIRFGAGRFNGCVESIRGVFNLAMDRGLSISNPAMLIKRLPVKTKRKTLPSMADFRRLLAALDAVPERRRAAISVRLLVYGGARPTATSQVMPKDVDLKKNEITFPPIKHQDQPLTVPMSKEMRAVVEQILENHPGGDAPLSPIADPKKALDAACKEIGIPHMTRYDMRHLFTTHLLESGVPVALVAALRGDKDGGAMLLRTYFHARNEAMHKAVNGIKW